MEGTMGHLLWSRYPLVSLVSRFTIMGDLPYSKKKIEKLVNELCVSLAQHSVSPFSKMHY